MEASCVTHILILGIINAHLAVGMHLLTSDPIIRNYNEAAIHCSSIEQDEGLIPMPYSQEEQIRIQRKMEDDGLSSIWLRGKRHVLNHWNWINGSKAENIPLENGKHCGLFSQSQSNAYGAPCSSKTPGHICEVKNCRSCSREQFGWKSQVCRRYGSRCFLFYCDNVNWFTARNTCKGEDWDLAILTDNTMAGWLSAQQFNCEDFWIGLFREWWGVDGEPETTFPMWKDGEPSGGNCMQMKLIDKTSHSVSRNCSWKTHTMCAFKHAINGKPKPEAGSTAYNTTGSKDTGLTNRTGVIIGPIVAGVLLVVIIASVVIYYKKKQVARNENNRQKNETDKESGVLETLMKGKGHTKDYPEETKLRMVLVESTKQYTLVNISIEGTLEPIPLNKIYTDVIWTCSTDKKEKIAHYKDIFCDSKGATPDKTLIYGDNGVGKTTLIRKILYDWCALGNSRRLTQSCLSQFKYVIYLALMDSGGKVTLTDLMSQVLKIEKEDAEAIVEKIKEQPKNTLIIFDGYDEFKEKIKEETEVDLIISGKDLKCVHVIVTCRVNTKAYLAQKFEAFGKVYKVKGFKDKGIRTYISKYPFTSEEDRSYVSKAIHSRGSLRTLANYPHYLRFLCTSVENQRNDISAIWPYTQLLKYSLTRYVKKYEESTLKTLEKAEWKRFDAFHDIGKLAAKTLPELMGQKTHIFSEEDIPSRVRQLGIFVYKDEKTPSFPQNELHVFFAAYLMSLHKNDTEGEHLKELLASACEAKTFETFFEFVAGLMQEDGRRLQVIENILSSFPKYQEQFKRCLHEQKCKGKKA